MRRNPAMRIDHRHLAYVARVVRGKQSFERLGPTLACAHQLQPELSIKRVDERLGSHRTHARLRPRDHRSYLEPVRLNCDTHFTRRGIARYDRKGVHRPVRLLRQRLTTRIGRGAEPKQANRSRHQGSAPGLQDKCEHARAPRSTMHATLRANGQIRPLRPCLARRVLPRQPTAERRHCGLRVRESARDARRRRDVERAFATCDRDVEHSRHGGHHEEIDTAALRFLNHQADILSGHREFE